jgi:hypothetical protein
MGNELYKIACEIVAEDRAAALAKLLALVNQGYDALRERGDLPISWSIGDMKGNGEMRAGSFLPNKELKNAHNENGKTL